MLALKILVNITFILFISLFILCNIKKKSVISVFSVLGENLEKSSFAFSYQEALIQKLLSYIDNNTSWNFKMLSTETLHCVRFAYPGLYKYHKGWSHLHILGVIFTNLTKQQLISAITLNTDITNSVSNVDSIPFERKVGGVDLGTEVGGTDALHSKVSDALEALPLWLQSFSTISWVCRRKTSF